MKAKNRTFPHQFYARNTMQLQQVLMTLGCEGIGIYWCLVEMLHESGGILPLDTGIASAAYQLHIRKEKIEHIVNDYGLFEKNEDHFWSQEIIHHEAAEKDLSEKRRKAAVNRWQAVDGDKESADRRTLLDADAEQMQCTCIPNAEQEQSTCRANAIQHEMQVHPQRKENDEKDKKEKPSKENTEKEVKEKEINKEKEEKKISAAKSAKPKPPVAASPLSHPARSVEERKAEFWAKVEPFKDLYGEDMVRNFFDYWTEMNKSRTKMKFETEKTYEIPLRLSTWKRNERNFTRKRPATAAPVPDKKTTTYTTKIE